MLVALCWLAATVAGAAPAPTLPLTGTPGRINLTELLAAREVPASQAIDAEALWAGEDGEPLPPSARWRVPADMRIVGRIQLDGQASPGVYVVQVPAAWLDEVQVWHRTPGSAWRNAVAGDQIPLSRWPFVSQSPAFTVMVGEQPVDLMVMAANAAAARVAVWLMDDATFRANQTRQANLSGLIMGLGVMVVVVTTMGAVILRRRANALLAGVSAWLLFTIISLNGYMAVWLTPELPAFNDAAKHFTGVMLAAFLISLTAQALDQRYLSRLERRLQLAAPLAGLIYACVQILWLPDAWRPLGALAWTSLALLACMLMCGMSAARGGRYVRLIASAVGCFGAGVLMVYTPFDFVAGLDLRAAMIGSLFYACMLLFSQALFARERYGRDVLGRAAIAASRDPLTALLSYQGFQEAYDKALLRQGADHRQSSVMLFVLPGLEQSGADHGFVLTERAVVRFAATLQSVLGDAWSIGRLSKTRFACIAPGASQPADVLALATHVLTRCTRMAEPLGPVTDFDLRIACTQRRLGAGDLKSLLSDLDEAARAIVPPKRIVML